MNQWYVLIKSAQSSKNDKIPIMMACVINVHLVIIKKNLNNHMKTYISNDGIEIS